MTTKLTESEITRLSATQTMKEWDDLCDEIKERCGGRYPADWYATVLVGGLHLRAERQWQPRCPVCDAPEANPNDRRCYRCSSPRG